LPRSLLKLCFGGELTSTIDAQSSQLPLLQIEIELGIFKLLAQDAEKAWTVNGIAEQTGVEQVLMRESNRFLLFVIIY
jgi:hypothetical protein